MLNKNYLILFRILTKIFFYKKMFVFHKFKIYKLMSIFATFSIKNTTKYKFLLIDQQNSYYSVVAYFDDDVDLNLLNYYEDVD